MYDYERFARSLASIDIPRSRFQMDFPIKTTFNHGQIIPLLRVEVLPGDTWQCEGFRMVLRLSSPLKTPIMDNISASVFIFFVPMRLLWKHWKNFMFENTESKWYSKTEYTIPMITAPDGGWNSKSLADYFGIRPGVKVKINQLSFRAYALIYNEWFRDQNLIDPVFFDDGDSDIDGTNGTDYVNDVFKGSVVMNISRHRDYFASCLPGPQKGPDVFLPLSDNAPVFFTDGSNYLGKEVGTSEYMKFVQNDDNTVWKAIGSSVPIGTMSDGTGSINPSSSFNGSRHILLDNAFADMSKATATTINQLRIAFQLQKFYERLAIGGSRYTEVIRAFFNVESSDARLQRPEFLAGDRFPVNVNQVINNSSDLGELGGYSMTFGEGCQFIKSFEEHGLIIAVIATQHSHSYQQGIDRFFYKDTFDKFFFPVFNNLGEQPVYNRELYAKGDSSDNQVFGYQENFPEYRSGRSMVTGEFRSGVPNSLDTWHLSDDYSDTPVLSKEWIEENPVSLDRVLKVTSAVSNQYLLDGIFNFKVSRPMSEYGVPGLIDHN